MKHHTLAQAFALRNTNALLLATLLLLPVPQTLQ